MANYINPVHYDKVMFDCKINDKLSNEAIELFELQAREVSRKDGIIFKNEEDRKDAIQYAVHDFISYWKSYKINPICQVVATRNFLNGEKITIDICGEQFTYTAKTYHAGKNEFKIFELPDKTKSINQTLDGLCRLINDENSANMSSYLHKVTKKINILDLTCYKNSKNFIIIEKIIGEPISKNDFGRTSGKTILTFNDPPPAFNYLTSMASNGIRKGLKKIYPKSSKLIINFSDINKDNGGLFNH